MFLFILESLSLVIISAFIILMFIRRKPKGYPPGISGPLSLPIIGNLHQIGTRPFITFMEMRKQYGKVFAIDFASYRGIVINDPKLIRETMNMAEFSGRPKLRPFIETCGGKMRGVIFGEGSTWLEHRRFTLRTLRDFGFGKLSMESVIQEEVKQLLSKFTSLNGQLFETKHIFNLAVVNSLWRIIIGERFELHDVKLLEIVQVFTVALANSPILVGIVYFFPWLTKIAPELTGYNATVQLSYASEELVKKSYEEQKKSFKLGEIRHFLDACIQKWTETTDPASEFYGEEGEKNLVKTIIDLFMAGIETTSTTLSWSILLLTVYPEVQEKFFQEIQSVIGLSRSPTLGDERSLPYTQAVMTEVLRFSSLIPLSIFHSTMEDVEYHGYKIPKDTMVIPNLYGVHHDPAIWGDPDTFRPERFITEDGAFLKRPDQPVLPFSIGKRACIGESLARNQFFLFLTSIFQKFQVKANPAKPPPVIDYIASLALQPKSYEYFLTPRGN